nr:immunoglobulin heavy chain junction region [Macaca mulatta]MOX63606.1 immunoglobulin heavy chain junction region [Macaca mulatta]MOX65596.1 immunoglobulin heavy chain junction region [Macaca mulatta]MOX67794.1 immunoglobulin heavy chain junction region [Macaca mulatta]MOX67921.1 immunoglobulin heavy chain junction region [Macaca mulatta]
CAREEGEASGYRFGYW